jgi:hypothetical protein
MKFFNYLQIATTLIIVVGCEQKSSKNDDIVNEQTVEKIHQIEEHSSNITNKNVEDKFLITNNSVGNFKVGGSWQNFAKIDYNYKYFQGYGTCTDACCDGGFALGNNLNINEYGWAENPEITIGALNKVILLMMKLKEINIRITRTFFIFLRTIVMGGIGKIK